MMTTIIKQRTAMYATAAISLSIMGIITGAWMQLLQMVAMSGGIMFTIFCIYNIVYAVLNKMHPHNTTTTHGGSSTIATSYNCENRH